MSYSLRGIELRYVLAMQLAVHGPATITELTEALDWHGFCVRARPSKVISDALRWEIERGRVTRLGRGRYGPGYMPRGTEHRIHQRVLTLREAAASVVAMRRAID
ncbi:hypothetical protein [Mycobacterium sp. E2479]|uniref:hypothetical protein n=1 Tax=Mycobacterium sp. E2479 TaxID=1834134 RepID=UPI0007FDD011|nr:hypothetical protein [Mycobacterium sp. E2479]OBH49559.1 hypothetical protein A5686_15205 [Mycobacterium sp. E2479]